MPTVGDRHGALDGLRATALAAVLLYHSMPGAVPGGFLGVEVFFVLSGYLLTSLLLAEHRRTGTIDRRRYYGRRARRLAPALLALLATLVVIAPFLARDDAHRLAGDVYASLGGVTNWHLIQDHSSYFAALGRPPLVRHLWSLAVELQFYAVCPLLCGWLARRRPRRATLALVLGIAGSAAMMAVRFSAGDPSRAYYGTDTRIGALLSGALLAVVLARRTRIRDSRRLDAGAASVASLALVALFVVGDQTARWMYPAGFLAAQLATAALIAVVLRPGPWGRALAAPRLRWLGERSYGIYLWHWPLVAVLRPRIDVSWPPVVAAVVTIALAVALGHASYELLERPFLRRAPRPPRLVAALQWSLASIAAVGLAALVVQLPSSDPIVSSLRTGQRVVSLQTEVTTPIAVPTTTTTVAPLVAAPAPPPAAVPAPPPGPPPGTVTVGAVGDSVMLGAAPQLQARFGATGFIDAKVGRQFSQGVDVVRQLREQGRLGEVAVVHLGTNGPPRDRDLDAMMKELAAVPHVLLVTVRMPRDWEAATNATLHAAAERHPTIQLVDWHGYSNGHPDWFASDGVHVNARGAQAYADLIGGALPLLPATMPDGSVPPG